MRKSRTDTGWWSTISMDRTRFYRPIFVLLILVVTSCKQSYTPKPAGYLRIDYPEKTYRLYSDQEFFEFEIPDYAKVEIDSGPGGHQGWVNVAIPQLNGKIHLSYKPVGENLTAYITDCRELVYKHTVKAQGIEETPFIHREQNRYGMVYDLKGDVASAVQFFITDSTDHFLRGSLYFNSRPNRDSLNPVIEYLREDIIHLIETTRWKY
ncbi:MAG: gliding motility lipoprotein GldD [Bacteroidales bacterium]|nr:gliding motility lipoprotein GldD [Bacteroidales bacterium]